MILDEHTESFAMIWLYNTVFYLGEKMHMSVRMWESINNIITNLNVMKGISHKNYEIVIGF